MAMQVRTHEQDVSVAVRHSCSLHQVTYYADKGAKPQCPVCDADRRILDLQHSLHEVTSQLEMTTAAYERAKTELDLFTAMRSALDVVGPEDLAFLKGVLYRYREDKGIALKVTHDRKPGRRRGTRVSGFIAMPRGQDPEGHTCSSIGGVALAEYYEEAQRAVGSVNAMDMLIKAVNKCLAGGID